MVLRAKQKLAKYRIERRLAEGGFATVYRVFDTIEGVRVALEIPHAHLVGSEVIEDFRREVRLPGDVLGFGSPVLAHADTCTGVTLNLTDMLQQDGDRGARRGGAKLIDQRGQARHVAHPDDACDRAGGAGKLEWGGACAEVRMPRLPSQEA